MPFSIPLIKCLPQSDTNNNEEESAPMGVRCLQTITIIFYE